MSDRRTAAQAASFVERWVRSGEAYTVAIGVAILTSVAVFLVIGGRDMAAVSVICLTAISCVPYNTRRGKEILNRYSPERNRRPLGL